MESGSIVEFIDRQRILCAVVLEVKKQRLRLLTENNREVNLASGRLSHHSDMRLDMSMGRDRLVDSLKRIATRRNALIEEIDIHELWEVLNSEQEWIDLDTMTAFCFPDATTGDHESAVVRAFFKDRLYFKFNPDRFFPHSEHRVEQIAARNAEAERRARLIAKGAGLLRRLSETREPSPPAAQDAVADELVRVLKSCYLFGKDSPHYALGKAIVARAGMSSVDALFPILVRMQVFTENANVDLLRHDVPVGFSRVVMDHVRQMSVPASDIAVAPERVDLTGLPTMTIDGQSTLDYDDALSIERHGNLFRLGIHIADVGHFIPKGSTIDAAAAERGSSIYMPDQRIPMLPPELAEDRCSLKAGQLRPAISLLTTIDERAEVIDWQIVPSRVQIRDQLSYYDVNQMADDHPDIGVLCTIAENFRKKRLADGAVQINLPEIHIWIDETGQIAVNRINRESPGRRLVAEIMIMTNWLTARFLAQKGLAAVYRSQPGPRERLYAGEEGTLFQNYMQRRLLNRFILSTAPGSHSGLGLDTYVTATSPIRKYFDLVTQRQIRAAFEMEPPYPAEEIDRIVQCVEQPVGRVALIQRARNRYWLLKHLETQVGRKKEAIVLAKRRNAYQILLTEYMIECDLPLSGGMALKPEDMVQVTIQQANARADKLSVFMG